MSNTEINSINKNESYEAKQLLTSENLQTYLMFKTGEITEDKYNLLMQRSRLIALGISFAEKQNEYIQGD